MKKKAKKLYYVYLARCSDQTLYTGYTSNLMQREIKHNDGDGAKYTKARRPVRIIYSEKFDTISEAMKRECQIKGWARIKKEKLINK